MAMKIFSVQTFCLYQQEIAYEGQNIFRGFSRQLPTAAPKPILAGFSTETVDKVLMTRLSYLGARPCNAAPTKLPKE
jgi:hypothetical protein